MRLAPEVAIVGAGPAGCALACFLRQRGVAVLVYDNNKRPDLIVGESLIPAAIPLLRKLGIEDEVKQISIRKPGASLLHRDGTRVDFNFSASGDKNSGYAYNVPRPAFDLVLRKRAESLGAVFVDQRATLIVEPGSQRDLSLSVASLSAAGLTQAQHPDLLVDATGRTRLFSRTLNLSASRGMRDDVVYFAHYKNFGTDQSPQGQVLISVLERGWSWRIPLREGMSVGVVLDKRVATFYGSTAQSRLQTILGNSSMLAEKAAGATRTSAVRSYSNYQLVTRQGHGRGWVLVGDAFGFVDPMLSPGVFMALESASLLDYSLERSRANRSADHLDRYCQELRHWHVAWQEVIDYFYDGRLLHFYDAGKDIQKNRGRFSTARILDHYYQRIIGQLVSGFGTRSNFKRHLLRVGIEHLSDSASDPSRYAVRSA